MLECEQKAPHEFFLKVLVDLDTFLRNKKLSSGQSSKSKHDCLVHCLQVLGSSNNLFIHKQNENSVTKFNEVTITQNLKSLLDATPSNQTTLEEKRNAGFTDLIFKSSEEDNPLLVECKRIAKGLNKKTTSF